MTDRVAAFVAAYPRQRVPVSEIVDHVATGDTALIGGNLAAVVLPALRTLAERDGLVLPAPGRGWDRWSDPSLPLWVQRAPRAARARSVRPARVWPAALESAAAAARTDAEFALLERIAEWLPRAGDALIVPLEERSLDLFGDEKALSDALRTRLFKAGHLTPDLLRCRPAVSPLTAQFVSGRGPVHLLVTENRATFQSILAHHRARPESRRAAAHIGWGYGKDFPAIVRGGGIALLDPVPVHLGYFGDLDGAGVAIARVAADAARETGAGLLRPAAPLYRWLIDHGRPSPASGTVGDPDLAWFQGRLRDDVRALIVGGERMAQEWLGAEALRSEPDLLDRWFEPGS